MSIHLFNTWGRKLALWGGLALGLAQVGCAHPVVMEPQVVVSSRMGYPPVYGRVHEPGPVAVMPQPRPIYMPPPPRVVYAPPVYAPPVYRPGPGWAYGGNRDERDWRHRHEHGHGRGDGRDGWRR
ncbi:hypothetical protein [Limnohabitans sp. T6-5]|uniref:hypothetical protein n=1 Tax=Limnohabitans sp. T6-5 TaxID=1100724 RepID=UPI000D3341F3|nr:hypothetical protein [Limnohabitans sp. T6-5]